MDPTAEEQLDYGDEEYVGAQKMQYRGSGTISALVDDEIIGEDDDYDDLYNDVNVGEGFLQLQRSEAPLSVSKGGLQEQKTSLHEPRAEVASSQQPSVHGVGTEGKYPMSGTRFPEPKEELAADMGRVGTTDVAQTGRVHGLMHDAQTGNLGFQGSNPMPQKIGVDTGGISVRVATESAPLLNSATGGPRVVPPKPDMGVNVNVNRAMANNENQVRPPIENGSTMLFVGELHWWTTDAELESVLSQYGRVKEIKFFDERASGKSKGYCQVEFCDASAASACKEGMNGYNFNGRACVVAFASPQTIRQMATSYMNKNQPQTQPQSQTQPQGRRPMNDGAGRGGGMNQPSGDGGRNFGRGGWGRGQGVLNRGPGGGPMRGRGGPMGGRNMVGNTSGFGSGPIGGGAYGQGLGGPGFGGLMPSQGMMAAGFDPTYMARGAGYGGFPGPTFPGMLPSFQAVNPMGLAGVAPHVNPAFFGRGMAASGMQMMGPTGMDGHHAGMWTDTSMGGGGGEEHGGRRTRESSYGGEDGASEYGYGEGSYEKGARSNAGSWEKERGSERDWSGNSEKRHRDGREMERDRSDRNHTYREDKDGYRPRERDEGYDDDWDRGQSSSRSRSRSKAVPEEDHRRSRDGDYGKRRRLPSE
ncbi:hypothetical protein C3L33_13420, partial [Rhododendron williamsianum]